MDHTLIIHDIKNRLVVLENELAALAGEAQGTAMEARAGRSLALVSDVIRRMVETITLGRMEGGAYSPVIESESPADFLREVLAENLPYARGLTMSVEAGEAPAFGFFDRNLVALALNAAIQNAVQYARSSVVLKASGDEASWLIFEVQDDGPGLGGTEKSKHATGIGHRLAEQVAFAHGGHASLAERPGGGTVFRLEIPA